MLDNAGSRSVIGIRELLKSLWKAFRRRIASGCQLAPDQLSMVSSFRCSPLVRLFDVGSCLICITSCLADSICSTIERISQIQASSKPFSSNLEFQRVLLAASGSFHSWLLSLLIPFASRFLSLLIAFASRFFSPTEIEHTLRFWFENFEFHSSALSDPSIRQDGSYETFSGHSS